MYITSKNVILTLTHLETYVLCKKTRCFHEFFSFSYILAWVEEMLKEEPNMRTGPYGFHDKVFANEMNKLMNATDAKYNAMLFREVLREGFFGMIDARDKYRELTANEQGMHATLIRQFIEWQAIGEFEGP